MGLRRRINAVTDAVRNAVSRKRMHQPLRTDNTTNIRCARFAAAKQLKKKKRLTLISCQEDITLPFYTTSDSAYRGREHDSEVDLDDAVGFRPFRILTDSHHLPPSS